MTDYHVITPEADELVMQVIDGQLVIVPPKETAEAFAKQQHDGSG